jgi:thiol-disulfide isomerase/thioredoxin
MKRYCFVLLGLIIYATGVYAAATPITSDKPLAILIAADWCANCKLIKPKLLQAYQGFENRIEFVTLDVTDDARLQKAQQQAAKVGQPKLLMGEFATGWVNLIDRHGKSVGELKQNMTVEHMRAALQALVARPTDAGR